MIKVVEFLGLNRFELLDKSVYRGGEYQDISESLRSEIDRFLQTF
jgi:hypothetical protein